MKTRLSFLRSHAVAVAGALLTTIFAGGCITHPGGKQTQQDDRSKERMTVHRPSHRITHPGGRTSDDSKEGPVMNSSGPAPITHPGG